MSYIPIYSKLNELDERLKIVEDTRTSQSTNEIQYTAQDSTSELYNFKSDVRSELFNIKTEVANITKELLLNSSAIHLLSNTSKDEPVALATTDISHPVIDYLTAIAPLATKEELVALATKEELVALATKEELVALATK